MVADVETLVWVSAGVATWAKPAQRISSSPKLVPLHPFPDQARAEQRATAFTIRELPIRPSVDLIDTLTKAPRALKRREKLYRQVVRADHLITSDYSRRLPASTPSTNNSIPSQRAGMARLHPKKQTRCPFNTMAHAQLCRSTTPGRGPPLRAWEIGTSPSFVNRGFSPARPGPSADVIHCVFCFHRRPSIGSVPHYAFPLCQIAGACQASPQQPVHAPTTRKPHHSFLDLGSKLSVVDHAASLTTGRAMEGGGADIVLDCPFTCIPALFG